MSIKVGDRVRRITFLGKHDEVGTVLGVREDGLFLVKFDDRSFVRPVSPQILRLASEGRPEPAKAPPVPCGSCPYRKDVPSGIWAKSEYDKLPKYDGETWEQDPHAFLCHQRDGHLCGGWLQCHGPKELLALRLDRGIDPSVFEYTTDVPVFESGAAARAHGIKDIARPKAKARKMVAGLMKKRGEL